MKLIYFTFCVCLLASAWLVQRFVIVVSHMVAYELEYSLASYF